MSTKESGRISTVQDLDTVVDADSHIVENLDDLFPYVENEVIRENLRDANLMTEVFGFNYVAPSNREAYGDSPLPDEDTEFDPEELKRADLEDFGIDYALLNPGMMLFLNTAQSKQYALPLASAYNSYIADIVDGSDYMKAFMVVAAQNPAVAAEEIRERAKNDDFVGVSLMPTGLLPPAGDEIYEPIYEAAQANDLPVVLHSVTASYASLPTLSRWNQKFSTQHVLIHPFLHMWHLTSIMFQGVPERYPDLKFVFQEAGVGYIPYMRWRLDDHYMENPEEITGLTRLPSSYMDDQFYFTTQPLGQTSDNAAHLAQMIEMAGPDSIMFSADLPHYDFDTPEELFDRIKGHFDAETVRGIMGETAVDLFNLS